MAWLGLQATKKHFLVLNYFNDVSNSNNYIKYKNIINQYTTFLRIVCNHQTAFARPFVCYMFKLTTCHWICFKKIIAFSLNRIFCVTIKKNIRWNSNATIEKWLPMRLVKRVCNYLLNQCSGFVFFSFFNAHFWMRINF